jgi:hypothetical protein
VLPLRTVTQLFIEFLLRDNFLDGAKPRTARSAASGLDGNVIILIFEAPILLALGRFRFIRIGAISEARSRVKEVGTSRESVEIERPSGVTCSGCMGVQAGLAGPGEGVTI